MAQQRPDMPPAEFERLPVVFAAAARLDVLEFITADSRALAGIAIKRPPHSAERDAESADEEKQTAPAESLRDPEQGQAQKTEAEHLSNRVHGIGARTLVLREPRRQNAAVGGKAG